MRLDQEHLQSIARAIPGSSMEAQKSRFLSALEQGGITREDAHDCLAIVRPYSVILLLRDDGHDIQTIYRWGHSGQRRHAAIYVLAEKGEAK